MSEKDEKVTRGIKIKLKPLDKETEDYLDDFSKKYDEAIKKGEARARKENIRFGLG